MTKYYDDFQVERFEVKHIKSGWVFPDGTFEDCEYGAHSEMAQIYIDEKGWREEFRKIRADHVTRYARDFLVRVKGFILLDCPTSNDHTQNLTYNPFKRCPARQKITLMKLFSKEPEVLKYVTDEM